MKINELMPKEGSRKRKKRVGRGESSGLGKTCGRGSNGQKSRRGSSINPAFEGGQTPFIKRIPKRGFSNFLFKEEYSIVNLYDIENSFENGEKVDLNSLVERGIIKNIKRKVKILGNGDLTKKLQIAAHKFSKSAQEKIEFLKGTVEVL